MTRRRKAPNPWSDGTVGTVGLLCEYLAQQMFGGQIVHDDTADITIWNKSDGMGLEVKAAGVPHFHILRLDQLDEHLGAIPFPLTHSCYLLYYYKNQRVKVEGRETTRLAMCPDHYNRRVHVATNMFALDVVDTALVDKWRKAGRLVQYPSDGRKQVPVWRIPRGIIKDEFAELHAKRNGYAAREEELHVNFVDEDPQGHLFGETHPRREYNFPLRVRWLVPHEAYDFLTTSLTEQGTVSKLPT